ncbi:ABC transporter substrate-binding protein [Wolinella succinogenes]|uniref:ABC transporter substrate-binding protein n=1 Tax=Wolinella succinogenes TaxID=844 RepID=UPI0023555C3D|nr:MqnA/MqnD/SBP family protein [Wolinella succinogenes]
MSRAIFLLLTLFWGAYAQERLEKLILSGPVASVSHPFLKMIEEGALEDVASKVEFRLWNNPDELRALVLQKEIDFIALPTNVAAILHHKNQEIELLNVSVWGILEIVSRDPSIRHLEDLKGKEILVPFRADMPDIILQALLQKAGLNPQKDVKLRYVSSPPDALQMLLLRRGDHVLLAEPATSMAMRKTGSFPLKLVAPELYRAINLQEEWGRLFHGEPLIPQAGIAAKKSLSPHLKKRVMEEYEKALEWYQSHPKEAGELIAQKITFFTPQAISDSIPHIRFRSTPIHEARESLERFFAILEEFDARLIGSKRPDDSFYQSKDF